MQIQGRPVSICTPRVAKITNTPRAKPFWDPCNPNEQHGPCWAARPVCGRMKMTRLTDTPRVEDPYCILPSASCCSAHSGSLVLTQNTNATSPKPNHFKISPILPLILFETHQNPVKHSNKPNLHSQLVPLSQLSDPISKSSQTQLQSSNLHSLRQQLDKAKRWYRSLNLCWFSYWK